MPLQYRQRCDCSLMTYQGILREKIYNKSTPKLSMACLGRTIIAKFHSVWLQGKIMVVQEKQSKTILESAFTYYHYIHCYHCNLPLLTWFPLTSFSTKCSQPICISQSRVNWLRKIYHISSFPLDNQIFRNCSVISNISQYLAEKFCAFLRR